MQLEEPLAPLSIDVNGLMATGLNETSIAIGKGQRVDYSWWRKVDGELIKLGVEAPDCPEGFFRRYGHSRSSRLGLSEKQTNLIVASSNDKILS